MHMTSLSGYNSEVSLTSVNMVIKISREQSSGREFWFFIVRVDSLQDFQSFFMDLCEGFFSLEPCFWGFA